MVRIKAVVATSVVVMLCIPVFARSAQATTVIGGTNAGERIFGTAGDDIIFARAGADGISAGDGNDKIFAGGGKDVVDAGPGNDMIVDDDITAGDNLVGRDGRDTLYSLDGNVDRLDCGADGGTAFADPGDLVSHCTTVIRANRDYGFYRVRIGSNRGNIFDQPSGSSIFFGRAGGDIIRGSDSDDIIFGGAGGDLMKANRGDDLIIDDDSTSGDSIQTGRGADITYMADGNNSSIDCEPRSGRVGTDDIVFADPGDFVTDCGHVFRVR
ncbi:MAG: hypothetical protein LC663_02155 [Actinobacteria bacterium]|nr:hypothetical protein [Actinomycetota bacterium]